MLIVVDASVVVTGVVAGDAMKSFRGHEGIAPPLILSEATSAIHELLWRGEIDAEDAHRAHQAVLAVPARIERPDDLLQRAWAIADRLGWAKTYDAEYVALAEAREAPLVTLDERLYRGAARAVETLAPKDLPA